MKKKQKRELILALCLLSAFVLWTCAVCFLDVRPIGVGGTDVGMAGANAAFHRLTGVHMALYTLTDLLSVVPLGFACAFALLGAWQWARRGSIARVDRSLAALGIFYCAVAALFLFFEKAIVNYRPILIEGKLEASYPSSTTLLVLTVMPSAIMQLNERMKSARLKKCVLSLLAFFIAFMLLCRLLSGVHWLSDIVGGILLSAGLLFLYRAFCRFGDTRT